jgi:hypothetical protein
VSIRYWEFHHIRIVVALTIEWDRFKRCVRAEMLVALSYPISSEVLAMEFFNDLYSANQVNIVRISDLLDLVRADPDPELRREYVDKLNL